MLFCNIDILRGQNFDLERNVYVGTEDDKIAYIGAQAPTKDYGEKYDGRNKLMLTGLYNMHAHSTMTLLRGYAENLPLQDWLNQKIFPFEAKITDEAALPATRLAFAEMLRYGTVSCSDMYFFDDARAQAVDESGIKCNLSECIVAFDPEQHYASTNYAKINEHLVRDLHGAFGGRLLIDMCLHSEYSTTPLMAAEVAQQAVEYGVGMHIHVSETQSEVQQCKTRHGGLTPVQFLAHSGVFDARTTAAHCVWLEDDDYEILREKNVTIASNPASNLKLGSGVMPLDKVLENNVRLAVGTDGVASNNAQNMFRELYLLMLVYRGYAHNPQGITPAQALQAASSAGAYAQGRKNCGVLEVGYSADLVVINTDAPWMQPVTNPINNLVYSGCGEDVVLTMVDGKVCYREGEWPGIDVEKAQAQTQEWRDKIVNQL